MKNLLKKYNNLCDTVIQTIVLHYEKKSKYNLTICLKIECFNTELNSWQIVEFEFTRVTEFKMKENNTTIQVIKEANFIEAENKKYIDFDFGYKNDLERVRNESDFYICFEEVKEKVLNHSISS